MIFNLKKKKIFIFSIILLIFLFLFLFFTRLENVANIPKVKNKIWNNAFELFMKLPDPIKSTFMIFSGKRSYSNLFNDYNTKFLPDTQYITINFERKKLESKNKDGRYTFYLETYNDKLIIISKNGDFYESDLEQLLAKDKKIKNIKLKTNNLYNRILDTLIIKDKIFISKVSKYQNCKNLEIHSAKLSDVLNFEIFKKFDECITTAAGAGRMQQYKFNNKEGIIISTNDSDNDIPGIKAQDDNSIFGKIVFIDDNSKKHEIISKGHRNAQGLFVKDNIILSTEHGPKGGDEINKIIFKKNYGWPIASYGEPYKSKKLKYLKNHIENGYEEPIHVFLPSIGISELIILPNSFDKKWNNNALVTSLNGRSIYRVKFQDESFNKVLYTEKIYIGERIRDIKYVEKFKTILIALERTGDVGILRKEN
jgi:hypothetical protein